MRRQARIERLLAGGARWSATASSAASTATKAAVREMCEPPAFFETLGVRYTGPFDGHDIDGLEAGAAATRPRSAGPQRRPRAHPEGPRATRRPRTTRSSGMHDIGLPKPGSYTAAFTEALIKEAEAAPGAGRHHRGHARLDRPAARSRERFPDRCFDVGIAEQHAVTAAAGMAMGGLRPVVAVYSTFLTRAFDQVNLDVGLHRQPVDLLPRPGRHHRRRRPVPPRRARHGAADEGAGHDRVRAVVVPGAAADAPRRPRASPTARCRSAGRRPRPARSRPRRRRAAASPAVACVEGDDLCIIAVGKMLDAAEAAADRLEAERRLGHGVGRPGGQAARPADARRRRPPPLRAHRRGRRARGRRRQRHRRTSWPSTPSASTSPRVRVLGTPIAFIPHGKPDAILADLGLDAAGITASALEPARRPTTCPCS